MSEFGILVNIIPSENRRSQRCPTAFAERYTISNSWRWWVATDGDARHETVGLLSANARLGATIKSSLEPAVVTRSMNSVKPAHPSSESITEPIQASIDSCYRERGWRAACQRVSKSAID